MCSFIPSSHSPALLSATSICESKWNIIFIVKEVYILLGKSVTDCSPLPDSKLAWNKSYFLFYMRYHPASGITTANKVFRGAYCVAEGEM